MCMKWKPWNGRFINLKVIKQMFKVKMYWSEQGGHTHVRVFAGFGEGSFGKCGELVFRNEEWAAFRRGIYYNNPVEFIKDETK